MNLPTATGCTLLLPLAAAAHGLIPVENWWSAAKMWTLMYRGGLLVGACAVLAFVLWRIVAARRERARLEELVASRTRQLRQSEELFRSIFEHATTGIFQSSVAGNNLRANPAMARICGYADPEQMQRELTDVASQFYVQPDRRRQINAAVASGGEAVDWESEIRRCDGSTVWISESVRAVIDPATGVTVYQGSVVDITARREMQAAQEQARAAAEAANAAKSAFVTHMTHELRTPLTGILSNARVALRDETLNASNRTRYALIADSGEHLLTLIDEVLDFSRLEAGRLERRSFPFSLGELLRTVTEAFRCRAGEKRLEFRCTTGGTLPPTVCGDALRLRQVLDNLLGNAFKFTAHGEVTLHVSRRGAAEIRFEVSDTGIGIPADQLAVIFEPFRQALHPQAPDRSGVGLGLHISTRLVQWMGGDLRVDSTPGAGCRFFFDLPLPVAADGEPSRNGTVDLPPPPPAGPLPSPIPAWFAWPTTTEIDSLLRLSLEGDIVRLRTRLQELAAADPALVGFTREVDSLAAGFRMEAIGDFLEQARKKGTATHPVHSLPSDT